MASINSLGINYSRVPSSIMRGLRPFSTRLMDTDISACVRAAAKTDPSRALAGLSSIPGDQAKKILRLLPENRLGCLFSLSDIWPPDSASRILKENFISSSIAGILSYKGMSPRRRAEILKQFSSPNQFNVVHFIPADVMASALSCPVLTPHEIMLMYNCNLPRLAASFPKINIDRAEAIIEAMSGEELAVFVGSCSASYQVLASIFVKRGPESLLFSLLDSMPEESAARILDGDLLSPECAGRYASERLLSRRSLFSKISPARLSVIFCAMDEALK